MIAPLITNRPLGDRKRMNKSMQTWGPSAGTSEMRTDRHGEEILTGKDLEDGREKEATSLYESEELAEEDDEGDQTENGG